MLIAYKYTRILGDVNRLAPEKMVPDLPYAGEPLLKITPEIRKQLVETYVLPWQRMVMKICADNPSATVMHWHSMDVRGSGNANISADAAGELRPMGEVFHRADASGENLRRYDPSFEDEVMECYLITEKVRDKAIETFNTALSKFATEGGKGFAFDTPYKLYGAGLSERDRRIFGDGLEHLVALARKTSSTPQVIVDFRKDLFATQEGILAAINAMDEVIAMVSQSSEQS